MRLVDAPCDAGSSGILVPALFEVGNEALYPTQDGCMRDSQSALGNHFQKNHVMKASALPLAFALGGVNLHSRSTGLGIAAYVLSSLNTLTTCAR